MNQFNNISLEKPHAAGVKNGHKVVAAGSPLPEILFITSYPPRECGIATYSHDLIKALNNKFSLSFNLKIYPLESASEQHTYTSGITNVLNVDDPQTYISAAKIINETAAVKMVVIQHEFGFFNKKELRFLQFLKWLAKPVIVVFHTVLPYPNKNLKSSVKQIAKAAAAIVVMTNSSADILMRDYEILREKITVIPHGTHLVQHENKELLKEKYGLTGKKILSTFGLLSSGKSIETTLTALPAIIKKHPDALFLIIGKTHPAVVKAEGETYRRFLEKLVEKLQLQKHVTFINSFQPLTDLLEYLQLTDIYLFTSKDPNQAVSGTFAYAISCGCPVISTPIPHAQEVLKNDAGIIVDFENSAQLSEAVISLLNDDELRNNIGSQGLHTMAATAWENAAIAHAMLFEKISDNQIVLHYTTPVINLDHIKKLTTDFGMIQFSTINHPDINSGYTLDDNARALVAMCQHFEITKNEDDLQLITIYFNFIKYCLQADGGFLNYVNEQKNFTPQNSETNLQDANGRAIWALGFLLSIRNLLPEELIEKADELMDCALLNVREIHSTRAMAFIIKGLYYRSVHSALQQDIALLKELANRLVQMYRHEAGGQWQWFESYLTYGNSILPEAMLCAWLATGETIYKEVAAATFDFLLSKTFIKNNIKVISNKTWLYKEDDDAPKAIGGEQPIDVAYTILALSKFYTVFKKDEYMQKMLCAFNWFLGDNHLHQIMYNPCTGGCYDGLEEYNVNLNQGAESTVSYLMARLTIEKSWRNEEKKKLRQHDFSQMKRQRLIM